MLAKVLAVMAAAIALSNPVRAEDTPDLLGTWVLVSSVTEKDGLTTDQFGSGAVGMMTLDARGRFMLTIIGPNLPRFASNNRAAGTAEENKAVMSRSIAMIGGYEHDPVDRTLTFRVESSTFPNWKRNATEAGHRFQH